MPRDADAAVGARSRAGRAGRDDPLHARARLRRLRRRCGAGRSRTSRASGRRSGSSSASMGPTTACWRRARCRAPPGSRAHRSTTPSTCSAARTRTRTAIVHASELRELAELTWGDLRDQVARIRGGLRALGVERGDRVAAYMPNIPEAVAAFPRHGLAGRGVVELLARLRRPLGDRPLRADRAEGAAGSRRLPIQRPRLRPPRDRRRDRRRGRRAGRAPGLPGRLGLGGRLRARRSAGVRARAVRPPAVGPVLVRHDRSAEGDRPGPGRHPARAPQEAASARRRAGRRPRVLVHDDRLDDVELPRLRPAHRGRDRALRRQPRRARHGRAVGPRRATRE